MSEVVTHPSPVIYADLLTGQVLIGGHALEAHIDAGGHPADVRPVKDLLVSDELDNLPSDHYHKRSETHWTERDCVIYGQWIVGLTSKISKKILYRAKVLGLGIGPEQIVHPDRCGSLANLYIKLESAGASINKAFNNWGMEDLSNNLAEFGQKLGRKPTEKDMRKRAKECPDQPYLNAFITQFGDFRSALDSAGWPNVYNWNRGDHVAQGVKFMLANDGTKPTQLAWDFLSVRKRGPSAATISRIFPRGFTEFKEEADAAYLEAIEEQNARLKKIGSEIGQLMAAGEIDLQFFRGAKNGRELAQRFAKYRVLAHILPRITYKEKLKIISSTPSFGHFANCVRLYLPESDTKTLERTSKELGVYEDFGSPGSFMQSLRVIDNEEFLKAKEKEKIRDRQWQRQQAASKITRNRPLDRVAEQ